LGQRSRKRARASAPRPKPAARPAPAPAPPPAEEGAPPAPNRSEARASAARASLEPLGAGERPGAVTVAAVVAAVAVPANAVAAFTVHLSGTGKASVPFVILQSAVLVAVSVGMWRARYWAVITFEALLGIQILTLALALTKASFDKTSHILVALGALVLLLALGYLFYKLVRAMARIQMPERRRPPA